MKNTYILAFLLVALSSSAQEKLRRLDTSDRQTSILFTSFPVIDINDYQENTNSTYSFYQAYKAISEHDSQKRLSGLRQLELKSERDFKNNTVSLGVLHSDFEVIKPESYKNKNVALDAEGYLIKTNASASIYNKNSLSIVAPLQLKHKGLNVVFDLPKETIFNTTSKTITSVEIDFGNDEGFKTLYPNSSITISYKDKGSKTLSTKLKFTDGSHTLSQSSIAISYSNSDMARLFNRAPTTFTSANTAVPNLTPYGEAVNHIGTGEYDIFLSDDGVLDKPIISVDGFDPDDARNILGIYDLLNFDDNGTNSNLGDILRAEGFDIVILNFPVYTRAADGEIVDGGSDFIERNAMLLVELIGIINGLKAANPTAEENVVIGPSMGGLISRYALNFMENQSMDHDTRLWVSFDTPHNGANVPIGFQYLFNKMAYGLQLGGLGGDVSVVSLRPVVDGILRSPAAKQILIDQFEQHITSGTEFDPSLKLPTKHPWSDLFFTGLKSLTTSGFPENTRKVSIINGSGIGSAYQDKNGADILPDFQALNLIDLDIGSGALGTFKVRFTPVAGQQNETGSIFIDTPFLCFCGDFSSSATVEAESFTDGADAGYGGLFDIAGLAGSLGTDPLINAFFSGLETDFYNFIPSISGMALEITDDQPDWFHVPNSLMTSSFGVNNVTPFDAWYMPDDNEAHVTLNTGNVSFALDEIVIKSDITPKIVLQGAALNPNIGEENLMRDDLRVNGLLPTTSPYIDAITCDAAVFSTTGNDAIVDWVYVELRDETDNTMVVKGQSALLQRDGDIINVDGVSSVSFNKIPASNYYVAIKHRNHMGIISSSPIGLSRISTTLDLSDSNNMQSWGTNPQTSFGLPPNKIGLWAGNTSGDINLSYLGSNNDSNVIKDTVLANPGNTSNSNLYAFSGYSNADVNMDGTIRYQGSNNDVNVIKDVILSNIDNTGSSPNLYIFSEQLPEN